MTERQVLRYLELNSRRLFILLHFGVDWRPEYGPELEKITQELEELRKIKEKTQANNN